MSLSAPPVREFEFGLGLSFRTPDLPGAVRLIESAGFDYLTCGEHVMFHGPTMNAAIVLSYAAAITRDIKLMSAISLVPLYPPAMLAKLAATLDYVSGGRFHLGVGVGGEYPTEFEACGVPISERGARTDEALEVITQLWSGEPVTFRGRFSSFTDGRLQPAPARRPTIWVAGRKDAAIRRAARFGDVWMPYLYRPEQLVTSIGKLHEFAAAEGREPYSLRSYINTFITVYVDGAKARRVATETVGRIYKQDFTGTQSGYLITGTPAECRERLREYADAGAVGAIFSLSCPPEDTAAMTRMIGEEIIPDRAGINLRAAP
jgi:probable F420-dependent oxidoreductase